MALHLFALLVFAVATWLVCVGTLRIYRLFDNWYPGERPACGPKGCYCADTCEWILYGSDVQ